MNRLANVTDTFGRLVKYTYGGNGRLSQILDFRGRTMSLFYDRNDNLADVTGPVVTGTPNGNDFPNGKTIRYGYDLNNKILTITSPNEVANGGAPYLTNTYGTNPLDPNSFGRVTQQDLGGTSASATKRCFGPAGGRLTYQYVKSQNQTTVFDRDGNAKQYTFNALGNPVSLFEFTGQTDPYNPHLPTGPPLRSTDPAFFVSSYTYDSEGRLTKATRPQGNSEQYTYDSPNSNRISQGNLLSLTRIPDASRGGGPNLVGSNTYEPIFNEPLTITNFHGDTVQIHYDYQEGSPSNIMALANALGVSISNTTAIALSLGTDPNGDGGIERQHGNVIEIIEPQVTLENGTLQTIKTDYWYNQYGQMVKRIQPEGYADANVYYPSADPNGDGSFKEFPKNNPPPQGDPLTGGYLKQVIMDNETLLRTPNFPTARVHATTTFTYDDAGNLVGLTDPRGIKSAFVVNQLNQVVQQLVANDTSNLASNEPQPLPAPRYETDFAYDSNNNRVMDSVENLDGNNTLVGGDPFIKTLYEYDILNDPTATIAKNPPPVGVQPGPINNVTLIFRYDRNQNPVLEKSPVANLLANDTSYQPNNVVSTIYDERGLVFKQSGVGIDPLFTTLAANSALLGELGAITTTPDTSTMTQSYDLNRNLATIIDGRGNATRFAYDGFDRRVFIGRSDGSVQQVSYDSNSNIVDQVNLGPVGGNLPGNSTNNVRLSEFKLDYDAMNRLIRLKQSLFNTPGSPDTSVLITRYLYDREGRVSRLTTPAGNVRDFSYDGLGRVVDLKTPVIASGSTSLRNEDQWLYDNIGHVVRKVQIDRSTVAPDQTFTTLFTYDAVGRVTRETDNMGNTYRWSYDSRGDIVSQTDAKGPLINDPISDPTRRFPFPSTPPGITMINSDGNKVAYTYDDLGRRTVETHVLLQGGVGGNPLDTSNPYIPTGTIIIRRLYDPNSRTSLLTDCLNRVTMTTYADGTTDRYSYDKNGNPVQHTDPNGSVSTYTYDSINRLVTVGVNRGPGVNGTTQQKFEYDGLSRVTRATDNNDPTMNDPAIVTKSYDSLSRVIMTQQGVSSDPRLLSGSTSYDNDNNPATEALPGGLIQFQYGDMHRPIVIGSFFNGQNSSISYSYIGTRLLGAAFSNRVQLNATYDGDGRAISLTYAVPGQNPLVQRNYAFDRMGNQVTEQFGDKLGMPSDYSIFDSLYRLTGYAKGETGPVVPNNTNANPDLTRFVNNKTLWTDDAVNNWPVVQVTRSNVTTTQQRLPNSMNEYQVVNGVPQGYDRNGNLVRDANNTYAYDFENRLVSVQSNSNPSNKATYLWNAMGLRAERSGSLNGRAYSLHYFYGHDGRLVAATDQLLNPVNQFVYGPTGIALVATASGSFYTSTNRNGNVVTLIDSSANVVERYDYSAYGAVAFLDRAYNPLPTQQSQVGNPLLFQGQPFDSETGFYIIGGRNLDPQNGRFIQRSIWPEFTVSMGSHIYSTSEGIFRRVEEAGTLMHELGHNLRLGHSATATDICGPRMAVGTSLPFRPHAIARFRQSAYMFKTVMAYLDNIIAAGDNLFRQDTAESINQATQYFVLAANILPHSVHVGDLAGEQGINHPTAVIRAMALPKSNSAGLLMQPCLNSPCVGGTPTNYSYDYTTSAIQKKISYAAGTFMHELGHTVGLEHGGSQGACDTCASGSCVGQYAMVGCIAPGDLACGPAQSCCGPPSGTIDLGRACGSMTPSCIDITIDSCNCGGCGNINPGPPVTQLDMQLDFAIRQLTYKFFEVFENSSPPSLGNPYTFDGNNPNSSPIPQVAIQFVPAPNQGPPMNIMITACKEINCP